MELNKIYQGDCLDTLKSFEDNSIDSIVTDPPYGLSFMGKKWDYDVPSQEIWEECLRVLKPGGYLLAFAGTRTQHRMAVRIEDAGFEIRDMIAWVYGSGFPKSLNIGKAVDKLQGNERKILNEGRAKGVDGSFTAMNPSEKGFNSAGFKWGFKDKGTSEWEGWGTALKPALEPITVARKPLSEKTVAENVLKWGTGGINIDESRVETSDKYSYPNGAGGNSFSVGEEPDGKRTEPVESNSLGRFPANIIHDNSEEVRECFPDAGKGNGKGAYNYAGREYDNKDTSMFNGDKPQAPSNFNDSGNASRFFKSIIYQAKASKSERNKGLDSFDNKITDDGRSKSIDNAFLRGETELKNHHPTVKPIDLMSYLVKLVTKKGGLVLDPFTGSGSTGIACRDNSFDFIGCELDSEYCKIASARTGFETIKPKLTMEEQDEIQESTDTLEENIVALGIPEVCDCGGKIVKIKSGRTCGDCFKDYV